MKRSTIQRKIFTCYAGLFLGIVAVFLLIGIGYMSGVLQKNAQQSLTQQAYSVSEQVETQNTAMYGFATNLSLSSAFRTYFFQPNVQTVQRNDSNAGITELAFSICGPLNDFYGLNIFREDGLRYVYVPNGTSIQLQTKVREIEKEAMDSKGKPIFYRTEEKENSLGDAEPVVGIIQSFAYGYGNRYTNTIEVQQRYSVYEKIVKNAQQSGTDSASRTEVCIFGADGQLIYPRELKDGDAAALWKSVCAKEKTFAVSGSKDRYVGRFCRSELSGWTTLVLQKTSQVTLPMRRLVFFGLLIAALVLLVVLLLCLSISKSITVPIKNLQRSVQSYYRGNQPEIHLSQTPPEMDELTELYHAFEAMNKRMQQYTQELVTVKTSNLKSQFAELQSQMNPHFLYNSLSYVSMMCEESGNEQAVAYCRGLADLLRYSASSVFKVTLQDEMKHVQTYLSLIQKRYDGMLDTQTELPDSLRKMPMPRLVLQPLAENCIKYALNSQPPWFISVEAQSEADGWSVTVSDTGNGFTEEKLRGIREKIRAVDSLQETPGLEAGGMGLVNTYTRLRLFYRERLEFTFGNQEEGGAFVKIAVKGESGNASDDPRACGRG